MSVGSPGQPAAACAAEFVWKRQTPTFRLEEAEFILVLTNANISPLPAACSLYITQQVSPLPDYSFKRASQTFLFHSLFKRILQPAVSEPQAGLAKHPAMHPLRLALRFEMQPGTTESGPGVFAELIVLTGLSCGWKQLVPGVRWPPGIKGRADREEACPCTAWGHEQGHSISHLGVFICLTCCCAQQ